MYAGGKRHVWPTHPPFHPPYQSQERPPAKLGKTSGRVHAVAMTVSHRRDSACPGLPCTPAWTRPIVNHLSARQQVLFSPRPFLHQFVNRISRIIRGPGLYCGLIRLLIPPLYINCLFVDLISLLTYFLPSLFTSLLMYFQNRPVPFPGRMRRPK